MSDVCELCQRENALKDSRYGRQCQQYVRTRKDLCQYPMHDGDPCGNLVRSDGKCNKHALVSAKLELSVARKERDELKLSLHQYAAHIEKMETSWSSSLAKILVAISTLDDDFVVDEISTLYDILCTEPTKTHKVIIPDIKDLIEIKEEQKS